MKKKIMKIKTANKILTKFKAKYCPTIITNIKRIKCLRVETNFNK